MKNQILFLFILLIVACSTNQIQKDEIEQLSQSERKNKADEYFLNGSIAEMKSDYNEAIKEYNNALEMLPSAGIYYALAKNYLMLQKPLQAIKNSKESVKLDSTKKEYFQLLASIYRTLNQNDSATAVYEKMMKMDSTDISALFSYASMIEVQKPLQALEIYNKIMSKNGPEWNLLIKIADLSDRLGKDEETILSLEKLKEINPDNVFLTKMLIQTYLKNKKYEKAEKLINDGFIIYPDDVDLIEYKARLLADNDKWIESANEYKKILKNNEIDAEAKFEITSAFFNKAISDTTLKPTVKEMLEIINTDSSKWEVKYLLAGLYAESKNDSLAIKTFKEATILAPWNNELWIRFGIVLFEAGKYDLAIEELSSVLENFGNDFFINYILGLSYTQKNEHKTAFTFLENAYKLNKEDSGTLVALGFNLDKLDRDEEAILYLNKALIIDSLNIHAIGNLALIHEHNKNYKVSDSLYNYALSIDSTDATLLNNYAYSLAERNVNIKKAYQMAKIAIAKEPENTSFLDTIGWIYFQMGQYKEAEKNIKKAYEKKGSDVTVTDHLGDVYFKLNKKKQAIEMWKKALEVEPENEKIKNKIEKGGL